MTHYSIRKSAIESQVREIERRTGLKGITNVLQFALGTTLAHMPKEAKMDPLERTARNRVDSTEALKPFEATIFYDWPNWDEHLEWIATAPVAEIVDWAELLATD